MARHVVDTLDLAKALVIYVIVLTPSHQADLVLADWAVGRWTAIALL